VYKVSLPSNRIEQWAIIESERFRAPVFRLFVTELEAVYEEMNRALDNKDRIISEAVDRVLYKNHPYGQQPTLGKVEQLKNPSLKNIGEYYSTYYVPNNMGIFISGDIDLEKTIALIDRYFSGWQAKPLPEAKRWPERKLRGREFVETKYQAEEVVQLAFRTVPRLHRDAEALQVLDMILDNATAGLINLNLNQQQRVRAAGAYPEQYNDYGSETLWGVPKEGQTLEEVERLLLDQLDLIKRGEFEDWIIPAIINDLKKNEKAGLESDYARVSTMRSAWIGFESWEHRVARLERMERISKAEVVRVARKYFGKNYVAGYRRDAQHELPKIEKPELAKIEIDPSRQSAFAARVLAMPVEPIAPSFIDPARDFQTVELREGVKLYYVPNRINDIFSFSISVDFGTRQDNKIGTAVQLLDKSGTPEYSPEALKKEWYKLGTDFGIGAGDNETTISLSGLDENFGASLRLMKQIISSPVADPAVLEELKGIILKQREDARKEQAVIGAALIQYNRYGEESDFLRMLPTEEIKALDVDGLLAIIRNLLQYKHAIAYTGSLPMEEVVRLLGDLTPGGSLQDPPPYKLLTARSTPGNEIYFFNKETAKADIRIEFGSVPFDEGMHTGVELYNNYFGGGMAGIVFQELREARGLAYSCGARYVTGYRTGDQNIMLGAIQTQCDKTVDALEAFLALFDRLPESSERFNATKEFLINQYRTGKIGFRGIIGAVRSWERLGLAPDPRVRRFEALQGGRLEDVLRFHAAYIANKPKLISVVGDQAKTDMAALGRLGAVRQVGVDEIFVK
jgi:predicted Zn-dependent peptidase